MAAHDFEYDGGYGCEVCGSRYHCSACSDASGMQGHYVKDDDGWFFHCQEPERWARRLAS